MITSRKTLRELEATSTSPSSKLELRPSTAAALEEEMLPPGPLSKRAPLERAPLMLVTVRVLASIKPLLQLRVAQYLVGLVDGGHLLLRVLLADALPDGLVRVVLFRHLAVGALDGAVVGVAGHAEDGVVIFCFGAFKEAVRFLEERRDLWGGRVVFFGVVEGVDCGFEVVRVELLLGFGEESREGIGV